MTDVLVRDLHWRSWSQTEKPQLEEIPPSKAQLLARVSGPSFDGGRTLAWLRTLGDSATWRAVRDSRTGHTVHCVSDRAFGELTADLALGLRLLAWMSPRTLTWYWWDQPWVREVPAGSVPSRDHLNGGWAVVGVPEVHVYRREEAHKVLLHESIHALSLDVPRPAVDPVRAALEADLGRQLWPHLGEAFTEFFAEWLWSVAGARSLRDAAARWAHQRACAERQAGQIWARTWDQRGAEDTNVFAYYVLKWVLMQHEGAVLLAADGSVGHWLAWWRSALPRLTSLAKMQAVSEEHNLHLGMTCGVDLR